MKLAGCLSLVCRELQSDGCRPAGKINVTNQRQERYRQSGGDTGGGRELYCGGGGGGGGCIFHQTIYSGTQPDPRQSKFGVKVLSTGDIMIVLKIWDNIKHQYQINNFIIFNGSSRRQYHINIITTIGAVMKNCLMTTISAGLQLESLEMHCKSFQCKYFIKCKTPDWIFFISSN